MGTHLDEYSTDRNWEREQRLDRDESRERRAPTYRQLAGRTARQLHEDRAELATMRVLGLGRGADACTTAGVLNQPTRPACYACDAPATGTRDRTREDGSILPACGRHADGGAR